MHVVLCICTHTEVASNILGGEGMIAKGRGTPPAAFTASPPPLMANYDNSFIQSGGRDEEAKRGDGDTKNFIRSSLSRVLVQYGSSISGNCSFKSL